MFILQNKNGTGFEIMSAVKKILPPQPRGVDRRSQARADQQDWRVNQRSYEFIGATFDPLTPMQTLARAKWMTSNHGFRYIVTPNVDHLVRLHNEPKVYGPLYAASWLSVCDSTRSYRGGGPVYRG